jgi:ribose transport system substrate-binding protein
VGVELGCPQNTVRRGEIELTAVMRPHVETERAIEAVYDHVQGREVPRFIDLTKDPCLPGTAFVTRENIDNFTAQYN